jgi:hypothetical protein
MQDYPYEMTNEIAFKLGKLDIADFPCLFYDTVLWRPNIEDFRLFNFFKWNGPTRMRHGKARDNVIIWTFSFSGELNENKFVNNEQKLAYLRGRLTSYSVKIEPTLICVGYANSYNSRNRFEKWAKDLIYEKFSFDKSIKVTKGETLFTCPGTPWVQIEADEEVINYIKGQ